MKKFIFLVVFVFNINIFGISVIPRAGRSGRFEITIHKNENCDFHCKDALDVNNVKFINRFQLPGDRIRDNCYCNLTRGRNLPAVILQIPVYTASRERCAEECRKRLKSIGEKVDVATGTKTCTCFNGAL